MMGQESNRRDLGPGVFIALEGSDGSGKSTILAHLKERFQAAGYDVIYSREPGGPPISEKIRAIILDPTHQEMAATTEALLYAASRAQHVQEVILPALAKGQIIFSDRYVLSSLVYQGIGRGLGVDGVAGINRFATGGLAPDLTLFLDVDPATVKARKAGRATTDRLEEAGDAFFETVYNGYIEMLDTIPGAVRIDARQPVESVVEDA